MADFGSKEKTKRQAKKSAIFLVVNDLFFNIELASPSKYSYL